MRIEEGLELGREAWIEVDFYCFDEVFFSYVLLNYIRNYPMIIYFLLPVARSSLARTKFYFSVLP